MKVTVSRVPADVLSFEFVPDEVDAIVAVPRVWFRFNGADAVRSPRVALMAYLMAKWSIGNAIELSGVTIPSNLGAKFAQDQGTHEFFMGPVNNTPERILPEFRYDVLEVGSADASALAKSGSAAALKSLQCKRTELGYVLDDVGLGEFKALPVSTNVDFFAAFTPEPQLLAIILIYLCVFDPIGVRELRVRNVRCDSTWAERVTSLCAEVGALVSVEQVG